MKVVPLQESIGFLNQGIAYEQQNRLQEALNCYNAAQACDPKLSLIYYNRGRLLYTAGKQQEMLADFQQAIELDPQNIDILKNIAAILMKCGEYMNCIAIAQKVIELAPNLESAWLTLADAHYLIGNSDTARDLYAHLATKFPSNTAIRMADALFVPPIAMSDADIDASRERFLTKLDELEAQGYTTNDPLRDLRSSCFYLAYHGRPHRKMAERLAGFLKNVCPLLNYTASHCEKPEKKTGVPRIGFVSPSMHQPTLNRFTLSIIEALEKRNDMDVVVFSNAPQTHPNIEKLRKSLKRYITLPMDVSAAQQIIAREEMDILIYLEIGSHPLMTCLPFARLAPVQCAWGGIPVTTGIPNVDYFISAENIEPPNAQDHYSEKLMLHSRIVSVFTRPERVSPAKTPQQLGLPEGRLYACPVLLFKLHPDMDKVFASILQRDPEAQILMFDNAKTLQQLLLKKRFAQSMAPELAARIHILPFLKGDDLQHMLRAVDVVLDAFHFSFGTTAYMTLGAGVPFVTWEAPYMCGRAGTCMFGQMEIPELIARTHEEFADIAIRLANDKSFYRDVSQRIEKNNGVLFDDIAIIDEFAANLLKLYIGN